MLQCDNPFWTFSLEVYAAPGVAAECLALQQELDLDVNMLLFCVWLGARRNIVLSPERIGLFEEVVRSWREDVVKPLRGVRDTIKGRVDFVEEDIGALRRQVLSVELGAERIEQALLFRAAVQALPEPGPHSADAVRANVLTLLQLNAGRADRSVPRLPAALLAAANTAR